MKHQKKSKIKSEIKKELKNKTILITGGAGSIASHFVKRVLDYPIKAIRHRRARIICFKSFGK